MWRGGAMAALGTRRLPGVKTKFRWFETSNAHESATPVRLISLLSVRCQERVLSLGLWSLFISRDGHIKITRSVRLLITLS